MPVKTLAVGNVEEAEYDRKLKWAEQMASGRPFLEVRREFRNRDVQNVSISYCFNCNQMCLWVYDQLVWPARPSPEPELHVVPNERREHEPDIGSITGWKASCAGDGSCEQTPFSGTSGLFVRTEPF